MPELPEVETIRLGLQKYLVGHKIVDVEVKLAKMVQGEVAKVKGAKVKGIRRFGKGLVIDLDNGYSIAVHIKLTGQLIYKNVSRVSRVPPHAAKALRGKQVSQEKVGTVPNKWTHVIFKLDRGANLYYNDLRQFGWIKIVKTDEVRNLPFFKELGPEFLKDLTIDRFTKIISASKTSIKPFLMDQKKIGGVGNIYANDALNVAKIDPRRKASSLSKGEIQRLFNAIEKVLKKGLEEGGASELSYVNALGQEGGYQNHFVVYGREGESCKNCGNPLKKIKLGGRGTYFCPNCQK